MTATAQVEDYSIAPLDEEQGQEFEYRALHVGAVVGLVLGVASVFMLLTAGISLDYCLMISPIPVLGLFFSLRAWSQIVRQPDQYVGRPVAIAGGALSLVFLVTGLCYGSYVYATEVPDGYERISFGTMKPSESDDRADRLIPDKVKDLDGARVFIKGYIRPDSLAVRKNAKQFMLVRDNNTCCFGDLSKIKYYDQIAVDLEGPLSVDYHSGLFRMGGKLELHPENFALGPSAPVFSLKADYAK